MFLVHYPVCVPVQAAAARWFADDPVASALGLAIAWAASVAAGAALYRWVEAPLTDRLSRRDAAARPAADDAAALGPTPR